jgi:hypothetical protein
VGLHGGPKEEDEIPEEARNYGKSAFAESLKKGGA